MFGQDDKVKKRKVKGRKGIGKFSGLMVASRMTLETHFNGTKTTLIINKEALAKEGNSCTILNAANEIAVSKFLAGEIKFSRITSLVADVMAKVEFRKLGSVEEIIECDREAREITALHCYRERT